MGHSHSARTVVAFIVLSFALAGCATSPAGQAGPPAAAPGFATPAVAPPAAGPKKRIAVAKFDAAGNFLAVYGSWDIGGGLAAQLTTALVASGRFVVVERAELASVLREQELSLQKIVSKETATQVSRVLGAQLLIRGAVTEFEQRAGGSGLRVGIGTGLLGGAVGGQSTTGVVGMDVRLIDATTAQVLQSQRVEGKVQQRGLTADLNVRQLTFGGDQFEKTVLGQATRKAIEQAVDLIVRSMEAVPWTGAVVDVSGDQVFLNAGANESVKAGDLFIVTSVVRELTDPTSGSVLGVVEEPLGEVQVVSVQEKFSIARMVSPFQTKRGDLVKVAMSRANALPMPDPTR